jgi:hypothetical protein
MAKKTDPKEAMVLALEEKYYRERVHRLFWFAASSTVLYLLFLTGEFLCLGVIPSFFTEFYLSLVATYAARNSHLKKNFQIAENKKGEWFVFAFWCYCLIMGVIWFFKNQDMPQHFAWHLFESTGGVTLIFLGTSFFNQKFRLGVGGDDGSAENGGEKKEKD